ncbi:Integral membrane protein OS=Streptomyces alboniger OX=132473 GN=CP975_14280 PE=4 SV=1 [Streptomyces alboniger]
MHGPGYAPHAQPPPSGGNHVTLRVVFVALAVMTCGMLAWAPMLRLALVTRKAHDWLLLTVVTALDVTALVLVGVDPGKDEFQGPGNAGMAILLSTLVAALAYYLFAEIRHFGRYRQPPFTGYAPPPQPSYGYPAPPTPAPAPAPAYPRPDQPTPHPPTRPAPARINQVRAELDELSDYLRRQEGDSRP